MFRKKLIAHYALVLLLTIPAQAQDRWQWPEHPVNLKVLPADMTPDQLRVAMNEFREGLGVRCIYCHKGEEGKPFTEWDFSSDEKENKQRAREMIRMLFDIDNHLAKINSSGDQKVRVNCYTCHHGRPRPLTLQAELGETYRKDGLDAALARLTELKKEYYGRGVYNFESDEVLSDFGQTLLDSSKTDQALRVFKLNTENFPGSSRAWTGLAEAYMQGGNKPEAIRSCEKAVELDPRNRHARMMLDKLKE